MKTLIVSRHKHPHFISIIPFIFLKDFMCSLSFNFKLKSQILKKTVNHVIFQRKLRKQILVYIVFFRNMYQLCFLLESICSRHTIHWNSFFVLQDINSLIEVV